MSMWTPWRSGIYMDNPQPWLDDDLAQIEDALAESLRWRHLQVIYTRLTPTGTAEDKAMVTFDLAKIAAAGVVDTWSAGDYTLAEGRLSTFFTSLAGYTLTQYTVSQYRWYARGYRPATDPKPFVTVGGPEHVTNVTLAGTASTGFVPQQVALSVTEKTAWPMHWGRFYLPGISSANVDNRGRWTLAMVQSLANAVSTLFTGLNTDNLPVVVPVTQVDTHPYRALLSVRGIQVDDIPDVIRRRRARQAAFRETRGTP